MEVNKAILEGMVLKNAFNEILNEGFLRDTWIKERIGGKPYKQALKGYDIIDVHNAIVTIDNDIERIQRLRKSSKTVYVGKDALFIKNIGFHHTKFTPEELDECLEDLKSKRIKLLSIYKQMGAEQTYYAAIAAQAAEKNAKAQRHMAITQRANLVRDILDDK